MIGKSLYPHLPVILQNLACNFYGWRECRIRLGEQFWDSYRWLQETDSSTEAEISAYQDEQIAALVRHAYHTVPYYRGILDEQGVTPAAIRSREDLSKLPVLTKQDVFESNATMCSKAVNAKGLIQVATSGTTGTALEFRKTREAIAFQWAIWWRHRHRFGVEPKSWHVNFTGKPVVPIGQRAAPFWRWNWPMRQALINMQHIRIDTVPAIVNFLNSHRFEYFSGYPSIIASFCDDIERFGATIEYEPRFIFLGAEGVLEWQRSVMERVTGAVVSDQYGLTEGCGNASRCPAGSYHEDWEFCFLECGDPESMDGGRTRGQILATGFSNYAFPFIRYNTGDTAVWEPESFRCPCGRASRVISEIEGRSEDFVLTPEGARIMRFDYLFKDALNIREAQVVQRVPGEIAIRIVPRGGFDRNEAARLKGLVAEWVSPLLRVEVEVVNEIKRSPSGKFRAVVSELGIPFNDVSNAAALADSPHHRQLPK